MSEPASSGQADATRDRAREGLEHLQAAARELIGAARAALDVAEGLIDDPEAVSAMVSAAGRAGDVLRTVKPDRPGRSTSDNGDDEGDAPPSDPGASQVERIIIR
jgi:hypothetical protein